MNIFALALIFALIFIASTRYLVLVLKKGWIENPLHLWLLGPAFGSALYTGLALIWFLVGTDGLWLSIGFLLGMPLGAVCLLSFKERKVRKV